MGILLGHTSTRRPAMLKHLNAWLIFFFFVTCSMSFARDYIIYGIDQDINMGFGNIPKKNYYINMGATQGLSSGTTLNVYRSISILDPYENKKRYNHSVKIGELTVLHTEKETAIGKFKLLNNSDGTPFFEVNGFMVGDKVDLKLD